MPVRLRPKSNAAVAAHRERLRGRGLQRLEVQVPGEDAPLVRAVAAALLGPDRAAEVRALLRRRFAPEPASSLKTLLAGAPLEGIGMERSPDPGRAVDL